MVWVRLTQSCAAMLANGKIEVAATLQDGDIQGNRGEIVDTNVRLHGASPWHPRKMVVIGA